jgi:hypothetical protein
MNTINKPKLFIKKKNIFIEDINNIIGLNKCYTHGSFIKYGIDKACDIDCHEQIKLNNVESFNNYIKKIANNKKILFVTSDFRIPYGIFDIIYNKLGYTDGLFNIHYNNNDTLIIRENINKINDGNIKNHIENLFNKYLNNKSLQNLIEIKSYVRKLIYPKWTLEELLKGEKKYFEKLYTIEDGIKSERFSIDIIYLDEPYKFMSMSNNINFQQETKDLTNVPLNSIVTNNQINYYTICKKLMNIIKRIFFTIKNPGLKKYLIKKYEDIDNFKNKYGNLNHSTCINKNKLFIYDLKYNKYKGKNLKKEIKYKQLSDKYENAYNSDLNKLNNLFKDNYKYWIRGIEPYLKQNVRFT